MEPDVNALPTRCEARARETILRLPADTGPGWLAGLPIAIKDITTVAGVRTTYGSMLHADFVPADSGLTVERLAEAIRAFHLHALVSTVALNVDLDVVLTVAADAVCAALGRRLPGYHDATPDLLQRRFLDTEGTIHNHGDQRRRARARPLRHDRGSHEHLGPDASVARGASEARAW